MNSKTIIGGIIGGIVAFLVGWLIYGKLLMSFFTSHSVHYDGFVKDPAAMTWWALILGNLVLGFLIAYIFNLGNIANPIKGATVGGIVVFLVTLGIDLINHALNNWIGKKYILADSLAGLVLGAIVGLVVGWWMGRSPKPAVA